MKKREIETTNENIKDMAEDNLKHESPTNAIDWHYFFGGGAIPHQHHYYKSDINGLRVEKHTFNGRVEYSIGNMDNAKIKFKTEKELLDAITPIPCLKCQPGMPCPFCNGSGILMPDAN